MKRYVQKNPWTTCESNTQAVFVLFITVIYNNTNTNTFVLTITQTTSWQQALCPHVCLYTTRVRMNIVFNLSTESRKCAYIVCSICADKSPPAHLLQALRTLLAIGLCQLTGWAGVISEQSEEGSKSPLAAIQTKEQVVQLDTNTSRAVIALVTQSEENIRLAAVSATAQQHTVTLCTLNVFLFLHNALYRT